MRTLLLIFAILCVGDCTQKFNDSVIDSKEIFLTKDAFRIKNRELTLKKLQELLKQASSSSNSTGEVTVTRQGPCKCTGSVCSCCSRILFDTWKQKACMNVTYDADEFSFTVNIMMNDRVLFTRTVSGKNPKPVCVSIPQLPIIKACVRFYNIYFVGRNIHMCVSMEGVFQQTTVFNLGLDCIRFGVNGVAVVKPEDGGGLMQIQFLPGDNGDRVDYDYDSEDE
nr:PREDICTED: uncharacterized protein LOC100880486 [Megachile rotundata]